MTMTLALALLLPFLRPAAAADYDAAASAARELLADLVAADTSNPPGNEAKAARLGAKLLKAAGIPYELLEFAPGRENLLARLSGSGAEPPLLLLAHIDVVGAAGQKWSTDPHRLTEKDGHLYGRGVLDDLGMAALILETMLLLKRDNVPLTRDVILAWTGDEESGGAGIEDLLKRRPELKKAGVALNEGGGLVLGADGKVSRLELQMAEKIYMDFEVTAKGPTGHSSVPVADNAIYRLSAALDRLSRMRLPARLLPVTRAYLKARCASEKGPLAKPLCAVADSRGEIPAAALKELESDPALSASLRTTCVATMLSGGTRVNALPAEARANVNCRILPDETLEDAQRRLADALGDPSLTIATTENFSPAAPSPTEGPGPSAVEKVARALWPGLALMPTMSRGATDSRFLRQAGVATYGIDPLPVTEEDHRRMHGIDERIPVSSPRAGIEFLHRLVLELAAAP